MELIELTSICCGKYKIDGNLHEVIQDNLNRRFPDMVPILEIPGIVLYGGAVHSLLFDTNVHDFDLAIIDTDPDAVFAELFKQKCIKDAFKYLHGNIATFVDKHIIQINIKPYSNKALLLENIDMNAAAMVFEYNGLLLTAKSGIKDLEKGNLCTIGDIYPTRRRLTKYMNLGYKNKNIRICSLIPSYDNKIMTSVNSIFRSNYLTLMKEHGNTYYYIFNNYEELKAPMAPFKIENIDFTDISSSYALKMISRMCELCKVEMSSLDLDIHRINQTIANMLKDIK